MTRGLENRRNDCFRNIALQMLMHAPKFLTWILSHNVQLPNGTCQFACQAPSTTEAALEEKLLKVDPEPGSMPLRACPTCAMKRLVEIYWGNQNMRPKGEPRFLSSQSREFQDLVRIDAALMRFTPQTGVDGQQQDPGEFQTRFLWSCLESVNYR